MQMMVVAFLALVGAGPEIPAVPTITRCPLMTDTGTEIAFGLKSDDTKKRDVAFMIDWGDGTPLVWSRYFASGMDIEQYHTFKQTGTMVIRVRATSHVFTSVDTSASAWCKPCTIQVSASLVKWKFPVPAGSFSSPALDADGNIYFGDEEGRFYSLTPAGKVRWTFRVTDTLEGAVSAAPAIANNTVYFPCEDKHVYALSLDGKLLWKYLTASPVVASPVPGPDGMIYATNDSGLVYCLNNQGIMKWQYLTNDEIDNGVTIGPDGTIYVPSDSLFALSPAGKRIWACGAQEEDNPFYGVSIGPDGNIYGTNKDGYLYCLDPKSGRIVWRASSADEEEIHGEAVFGPDNTIYFGSDDYYLNAKGKDGTVKTLIETDDKIQSTPAVNSKGTIYIFSLDGFVYSLTSTGTVRWKKELGTGDYDWAPASPVIAPDGTVYVSSFTEGFYAFEGDAPALNTRWSQYRGGPQHTGQAPRAK